MLKRYLMAHHVDIVDHREAGGGLWAISGRTAFKPFADLLETRSVRCKYHPARTRKREPRSSWQIDVGRRLS
jgi:hypothetical protein